MQLIDEVLQIVRRAHKGKRAVVPQETGSKRPAGPQSSEAEVPRDLIAPGTEEGVVRQSHELHPIEV